MEQAFSLASQSQKAGNHQDAVKLYKAIIEVRPDHAWANHNLGSLKRESGTPHEAIGYLKAALLADDGEALFWISYIDSLIELGLIADAEATLTQARSLGLNEDVAAQLEHKAHAAAQTIVSLDSDPSQLERKEVATSYNTAKYAIAEQQAVALTRKYPNHALGWKVLGAVFLSTNRKTESVEMMQQAIRCSAQDADAHKTLGLILSEV
jgi:predicted Zn-dependent protease